MIPLSSAWGVWTGKEIEGEDQLGICTLFIRDLRGRTLDKVLYLAEKYRAGQFRRVWICKEYISGVLSNNVLSIVALVHQIRAKWPTAVIAVEVSTQAEYHGAYAAREILESANDIDAEDMVLYVKLPWIHPTKSYDYICVGKTYSDKAVKIQGNEVRPEQYGQDVCLDNWAPLPEN